MKELFPVTQSILSPDALKTFVQEMYKLPVTQARFLTYGLNHTYSLESKNEKYSLRVYRLGWRSLPDIKYEVEALVHIQQNGASVSYPLASSSGQYVHELSAPEGAIYAVLFTHAPGLETRQSQEIAEVYGKNAALVHNASDTFSSLHKCYSLDLKHLLDEPVKAITTRLEESKDDSSYVLSLHERLHDQLSTLSLDELDQGFCHGDFHGGNAHIDDETFTFIDFDCCGYGFRAYDIAVYKWGLHIADKVKYWSSFITSYQSYRQLSDVDLETVPLFAVIRQLWFIGLHAGNAPKWGEGYLDNHFLPKELERLEKFVNELL